MIIFIMATLGLALGSFVNALVWRIYMQDRRTSKNSKNMILPPEEEVSITKGRSMCPHCRHTLAAKDLIPVVSWLLLGGKCRYCRKPIGWQYPLVELATAGLFVASYIFWPLEWNTAGVVNFGVWLVMLVGFMALVVYDLRWMLLPNRLVYPLLALGLLLAVFNVAQTGEVQTLIDTALSAVVAGGLFYVLYIISSGKWIGGGDVKIGFLIGLLLADPYKAFLMLLTASVLGTLVVLPGLILKKLTSSSRVPFGPFLIIAAILAYLFGAAVIDWYKEALLLV